MASKTFTVFSRKLLLLLLLVIPRRDPLCFSAQSGGRDLPDATGIPSVLHLIISISRNDRCTSGIVYIGVICCQSACLDILLMFI